MANTSIRLDGLGLARRYALPFPHLDQASHPSIIVIIIIIFIVIISIVIVIFIVIYIIIIVINIIFLIIIVVIVFPKTVSDWMLA